MVGDQLFTDVLGGKLCGLYTILTEPIEAQGFSRDALLSFFRAADAAGPAMREAGSNRRPSRAQREPALAPGFLEESDIDGSYVAIRVAKRRRRHGDPPPMPPTVITGCNVTYPLKEEALERLRRTNGGGAAGAGRQHDFLRSARSSARTPMVIGARSAIEALLDEPVALKRIGVLGYGATARAILAELQDNDAYTFVWGRNAQRVGRHLPAVRSRAVAEDNPPEIVLSTLPPDVSLPDEPDRSSCKSPMS